MRFQRSEFSEAEIDMTSMLDVVFIMLIFFIVTSSFIKESGMSFSRPSAGPSVTSAVATPILTLNANGEIRASERVIDLRTIPAWIEQQRSQASIAQVIVQADENSDTDALIAVVNQLNAAGVSKVSVGTFH